MGKIFNNTTINSVAVVLAIAIVVGARAAYPAYREAELFDLGYEHYLASQPEMALEAFTLFLREFPQSSAKDAAMFWMGKCLILLKHVQDARNIFDELTREFPESPLKPYAIREMEKLGEADVARESEPSARQAYEGEEGVGKTLTRQTEIPDNLGQGPAWTSDGGERRTSISRSEGTNVEGTHRETLQSQEERVSGKSAESFAPPTGHASYIVQVAALNNENAANRLRKKLKQHGFEASIKKEKSPQGTRFRVLVGEFRTRKEADVVAIKINKRTGMGAFSVGAGSAKGVGEAPLSRKGLREDNAQGDIPVQVIRLDTRGSAKSETREPVVTKKDEVIEILIEGVHYSAQQVSVYMHNSLAAIHKLKIREVIWRTGNVYEDFINEQVLYEEARRSGISHDEKESEKVTEKYRLLSDEVDYLQRYLMIARLVDKKLRESPAERVVESLVVRYTDGDRREKELLASELQAYAKNGRPFGEIHALYPQRVSYTVMGFQALQEWIKKEIELLENGEISVFWSGEGYIILKPVLRKLSLEAFEDMDEGKSNTVRALVNEFIVELRKERRKIEIVRDD